MYDYMIGPVKEIVSNAIILETNNIGYFIYTPNPFSFEEGKEYKVYLYQQIKEDEHLLFGFKEKNEKEIKTVLAKVDSSETIENQIKQALSLFLK